MTWLKHKVEEYIKDQHKMITELTTRNKDLEKELKNAKERIYLLEKDLGSCLHYDLWTVNNQDCYDDLGLDDDEQT